MTTNYRWLAITTRAAGGALLISLALSGLTPAAGPRSVGTAREEAVDDVAPVSVIKTANEVDENERVATKGTFTNAGTCRDEGRRPLAEVRRRVPHQPFPFDTMSAESDHYLRDGEGRETSQAVTVSTIT
jgi:hypothetical protein